ncbi:MAG: adenylate cyclase [Clostridia bacterium]|nr:adenylate cyclase [Clostridia bacterium]
MEIERKFIVNELPSLENIQKKKIKQGYVTLSPELRVRQADDKYYLTKKGEGFLIREEEEIEISASEGEKYFSQCANRLVYKTRYYIPYKNHTIELDIYEKNHKGLVVCEVEFSSVEEASGFIPPTWFGEEITENREYRNKYLALMS